jgi:hypothetical protein
MRSRDEMRARAGVVDVGLTVLRRLTVCRSWPCGPPKVMKTLVIGVPESLLHLI